MDICLSPKLTAVSSLSELCGNDCCVPSVGRQLWEEMRQLLGAQTLTQVQRQAWPYTQLISEV